MILSLWEWNRVPSDAVQRPRALPPGGLTRRLMASWRMVVCPKITMANGSGVTSSPEYRRPVFTWHNPP